MDIKPILEFNSLLRNSNGAQTRQRGIAQALWTHSDKTYLGLCGPRGAGKTVLLRQYLLQEPSAVYISLDTLDSEFNLFEALKLLSQSYGFKVFLLDEIHFNKHIDQHLKSAFDFLELKIIFTSSIALKMLQSAQDLSRRVKLISVSYFSLREFIFFSKGLKLDQLSLQELLYGGLKPEYASADLYFREYLEGGVLPFALEVKDWKTALTNILKRVVLEDIPRVHPVTLEETECLFKAVKFIGTSSVDGINPSSLAKNLSITHYKAEQYLQLLEQAFIVHRIMPRGTNVLREPKILLNLPYRLLYGEYEKSLGGLREDFAVGSLQQAAVKISYIKNSRGKKLPDYVVELNQKKILIEIGGSSKGMAQFRDEDSSLERFVLRDGAPYDAQHRPLTALGLLSAEAYENN
jgi:predicted AAA+ superfamily ATPase